MLSLLHVNAHPDQNSWYDYAFLWMHMQNRASVVKLSLQWFHSGRIPHHPTVLSISFEVDVPTGKVGGSLLFERQRCVLPRGVLGHAPPQKILKFRCLEMLFSTFSRQYLGLKNNQTIFYVYYKRSFPQNLNHWLLEKSEMINLQMLIQTIHSMF